MFSEKNDCHKRKARSSLQVSGRTSGVFVPLITFVGLATPDCRWWRLSCTPWGIKKFLLKTIPMTTAKPPTEFEIYNSQVSILTLPIFTRAQLAQYNGSTRSQYYVAIRGYIYDVSSNEKNYGPGKSYHRLVGKDVSRLLGMNKLKLEEENPLTAAPGTIDTWSTEDLTEKQNNTVDKWVEFFRKRYRIVGVVVDHKGRSSSD